MGKITGFVEFPRRLPGRRPIPVRIRDWREVYEPFPEEAAREQGARCMDCGIPFCHEGCPLGNLIPEWNDLVWRGQWAEASERLHATNNFPEFTGRLCPAPCEGACVLGINADPVTIERVEYEIAERAFAEDWVVPQVAEIRTGKSVAVVGFGPGGPGLRPAAGPGRPRRGRLRAGRTPRRAAALRHPRVQDGEGRPRPPPGPARGRGGHLPLRHRRGGRGRHSRTATARPATVMPAATHPSRGSGGASAQPTHPDVAVVSAADSSTGSTPSSWPAGPRCRGTCPCPVASCGACTGPWST